MGDWYDSNYCYLGILAVLFYHRVIVLINPFRSPASWLLTGLSMLFIIQAMHMVSRVGTVPETQMRDILLVFVFGALNALTSGVFAFVSTGYLDKRDQELGAAPG